MSISGLEARPGPLAKATTEYRARKTTPDSNRLRASRESVGYYQVVVRVSRHQNEPSLKRDAERNNTPGEETVVWPARTARFRDHRLARHAPPSNKRRVRLHTDGEGPPPSEKGRRV